MNLETKLAEPLWAAIETAYQSRNYTSAILDAIYYLGDFIREKTGLQSDGVLLVGQAFGGKSPKLRVNKLQTQSEWDIQKGTASLLTGLYQGIRNPRSHEKHPDTKEDADAIILFVDYLLRIIGASKGAFSKSEFLDRVFDSSFVERQRYAELLVEEIPTRHGLDIMIEVYRRKEKGEGKKLALFSQALMKKLTDNDVSKLAEVVSDELNRTISDASVRLTVQMFPVDFWIRLDESARLRSENKFLESIREGEYLAASDKCIKGAFGTWGRRLISTSLMKEDFVQALLNKLASSNRTEQDYVLQHFPNDLLEALSTMEGKWGAKRAISIIDKNLKAGDKRFHDLAGVALLVNGGFWEDGLKQSYDSFQEAEPTLAGSADDLPF